MTAQVGVFTSITSMYTGGELCYLYCPSVLFLQIVSSLPITAKLSPPF